MNVLIADDDPDLQDVLTYILRREGYTPLIATDGAQALRRWEEDRPDLVLLDCNLPKLDGFEVCRRIRHTGATPIIMLTARTAEEDIVRGLQAGADDYVVKPFSARQLHARIAAVLRRSTTDGLRPPTREVRVGNLVLDLQSHQACKGGEAVQLTRLEFRILYLLALNAGWVVPYSRLIEYAWGYDDEGNSNLLKTHVCHIREKLRLPPEGREGIKAITGVGYQLARADPARELVPAAPDRELAVA